MPLINAPGAYSISEFEGAALILGRHIKQGGAYFKIRVIILNKFHDFLIFPFQVTINNYHYDAVNKELSTNNCQ